MKTLICPYTEHCLVYQNWTEQTKDKRLDIIINHATVSSNYYVCTALDALSDVETGIQKNKGLKERLESKESKCSYIALLNNSLKR